MARTVGGKLGDECYFLGGKRLAAHLSTGQLVKEARFTSQRESAACGKRVVTYSARKAARPFQRQSHPVPICRGQFSGLPTTGPPPMNYNLMAELWAIT